MVVMDVPSAWAASIVQLLTDSHVDEERARAAARRVAADVRAGEAESIPDVVDEERAVLDLALVRGPLTVTWIIKMDHPRMCVRHRAGRPRPTLVRPQSGAASIMHHPGPPREPCAWVASGR
jgi:hypothetical protein